MKKGYKNVAVAEQLLAALVGPNKVGLRFARGTQLAETEFFASLEQAEARIEETVLDQRVSDLWVGSQAKLEDWLSSLLHKLNERRGFGAVSSANKTSKVYDLAF